MYDSNWWRVNSYDELKTAIEKNPPSQYGVYKTIRNTEVKFFSNLSVMGRAMFFGVRNGEPRYHVLVRAQKEEDEEKLTLVHEFLHIFYKDGGTLYMQQFEEQEKKDKLIEEEAKRFVKKNPEFTEWLYRRYRFGEKRRIFLQSDIESFE